jgi:hypothetical protein
MRDEYDFSSAVKNPFVEQIRKEGMTISALDTTGAVLETRYYPPGTVPSTARTVHVYAENSEWVVRVEGATRAFRRTQTEAQAMELGVAMARKSGADLVLHQPQ